VAQPSSAYEPRDPTSSILYGIVRDHFETFRAHAASLRDGEGLPRFVEQEFRDFLKCGCLAGDFARFRCTAGDTTGQNRSREGSPSNDTQNHRSHDQVTGQGDHRYVWPREHASRRRSTRGACAGAAVGFGQAEAALER
jgi:hypothetical protein